MIRFFVPGIPVAKGSAKAFVIRGTNRAVVTQTNLDKQKPWASLITTTAAQSGAKIISGPVMVSMQFFMPRPKSHFKSNGLLKPNAPKFNTSKPDVDKLVRLVFDALTGVVWNDDSQANISYAVKYYTSAFGNPGVDVMIHTPHTSEPEAEQ